MKLWAMILSSVSLAIGLLCIADTIALADTPLCAYMPETGHNIHGVFQVYYRAHNGSESFGAPLTEAFWEKDRIVQYFERARFEFHPENPEPYRVQLGMLGEQYYGITDLPIKSQAIPPANNPNFRYFPESGQMISFAIKEYFDRSGRTDILGYPVSGLRFEGGSFVQYFQRQRLVWNPAEASANKVRPSPVGRFMLDRNYAVDFKWRARMPNDWCGTPPKGATPTPAPFLIPTPTAGNVALNLQVRVRFRQTGVTGPQYVDVTVEDQNSRRVPNVALYAVVYLANGERHFPLLPTNASGNSTFGFEIGNQPQNTNVTVEVNAFSGGLTASARESFVVH
jgi:hypothetical protein